jgi:AraC-like DNA-binding protein
MALDSFECKIITGGYNHCNNSWNKSSDELDRCFKIYLPVEGEAIIELDHTPVRITPGNIYFLSGFNISAQKCVSPMEIYWLHFVPASLYLRHILLKSGNTYIWNEKDFAFAEKFKNYIQRVFRDKDYTKPNTLLTPYTYEEAKLHSYIIDVIAEILKKSPVKNYEKTDELKKLDRSLKFMNDEFKNNPSLNVIASKSAMAPNYFHRIFKKNFGLTPFTHMQRLRMEVAIRLLMTTSKSIKEVAFETGYTNEFYFYRQFKKYSGYSPSEMRKIKPF